LRSSVRNSTIFSKDVQKELEKFIDEQYSYRNNQNINWFNAWKTSSTQGEFFSSKINVGKSPFGRGMFALEDITPGEILIIEQPLIWIDFNVSESQKISENTEHVSFNLNPSVKFQASALKLFKVSK
jgi:hypothetical protein